MAEGNDAVPFPYNIIQLGVGQKAGHREGLADHVSAEFVLVLPASGSKGYKHRTRKNWIGIRVLLESVEQEDWRVGLRALHG